MCARALGRADAGVSCNIEVRCRLKDNGTCSPARSKVHLANVLRNGARHDVLLTTGCPHCKGTILLDSDSVSHSMSLAASGESRPTRPPRHAARLSDVMRTRIPCVAEDTPLASVIELLSKYKATYAAVVDSDRRPLGIITPDEIFRQLALEASRKGGNTAADAMSRWVVCLEGDNLVDRAMTVLASGNAQCIVVVSDSGHLRGVVTPNEIVRWIGARSEMSERFTHGL